MSIRVANPEIAVEMSTPAGWRRILKWLSPSAGGGIPSLDGLRAIAVLLVMSFHAYHPDNSTIRYTSLFDIFRYGYTGVQLFFVLSGFLLFLPYARWLFGLQAHPSTGLFYQRRILRVGPAYWVNITILVLATRFSLRRFESWLAHAVFLHNFFYDAGARLNGVLWTMAVEVQFYVLLPLLAWAIFWVARITYRLTKRLDVTLFLACSIVIALCVGSSMTCQWLVNTKLWHKIPVLRSMPDALVTQNSLPYWLGVFAVGMACSLVYVSITRVKTRTSSGTRELRIMGTIVGVLGIVLAFALALAPLGGVHVLFLDTAFGLFFGFIVLGLLLGAKFFRLPFEFGPLRFLGQISYSLYLWHLVILTALQPHLTTITDPRQHMLVTLLIDFAISVPVAYISFLATERPFFALRRHARDSSARAETPQAGKYVAQAQVR